MSDDLTFKFNFNDFCEAIAVSKEYPVFAARDLVSHFLLSKLNFGSDFKRFAAMQKLGGTRTRLYFKNLSEWETLFPSLPEQKKIAAFLGVVDAKIATLRAKVSGLETYKRGLMQALFSQRLRFTKPNGTAFPDWVEKPFAEIASRARSIFDPTRSDDRPTLVELENIESMTGKIIGESNLVGQVSLKTEFRAGEILFGKLRPYLRKFARPYFDGVCSSEIWVLRGTKTSNAFLYYLVQSSRFNRLANISSGSKMPRSDWATIADSGFELPHPDEQKKSPMPFLPWMPKFEPLQRKSLTWKHSRRVCFSRCLCKISHVQPSRSKLQFSDRRSEWFNLATGFHGKTLLGSIDCWKTQQNGRKGIRQTFNFEGLFRWNMVRSALDLNGSGGVKNSDLFNALDPTEKGGINYYLGMIFLKICAQDLLSIPWMIHFHWMKNNHCVIQPYGKSSPDLLGYSPVSGKWKVFEAKGRNANYSSSVMQQALKQAKCSISVDGASCDLHVGSQLYRNSNQQIAFTWKDPELDDREPFYLETDRETWQQYYRSVFDLYLAQKRDRRKFLRQMGFKLSIHRTALKFIETLFNEESDYSNQLGLLQQWSKKQMKEPVGGWMGDGIWIVVDDSELP